jgi:dTDP-4-amino-4,6-dideoxygalactose transaminase
MAVPLLDLKAQYAAIRDDVDRAVRDVLESQHFIGGAKLEELEHRIASYSQCKHGIGVSSGTDALLVCLMAESIGPGDEVIVPNYSFFATAGVVSRLGATPVFVDIEPRTYGLDVAQIEAAITPRTRAIVPVHLFGQIADLDPVLAIAARHGLVVIEDAAQAIGAEVSGRRAGSMGHYGCLSFFPSKNLGGAGDGGMVVTNDDDRADRLRTLRIHGAKVKYHHTVVGANFRLDALQAAILGAKLPYLDGWTAARQRNAARYRELLSGANVELPHELPERRHVYNQFVIRCADRDRVRSELGKRGISTEVYYPVPFHKQPCFASVPTARGSFPESDLAARTSLALPIYPELTAGQMDEVVSALRGLVDGVGRSEVAARAG